MSLAGCGSKSKLVGVTGKVTKGGQAVTGGSLWFHPEGGSEGKSERMSGQLQTDGTFTARTYPHGDGIPPGNYKVTLSPDLAARINAVRYADVTKTPWAVTVPDSGLKDQHFEVK